MRTQVELNATNVMQVLNEHINTFIIERRFRVRDAVSAGMKALQEEIERCKPIVVVPNTPPLPLRVNFTEETFEALCKHYEEAYEKYDLEMQRGSKPVGHGVYAEVVDDDEFAALGENGKR